MKPTPLCCLFLLLVVSLCLGSAGPLNAQAKRITNTTDTVHATTGKRIALVIGNNNYSLQNKLVNPVNDANAFAKFLHSVNFDDVDLKTDLKYDQMITVLETFAKKMKSAAVVVFYYSGHGIQVKDTNYLVPIDARIATDGDVVHQCVPLDDLMNDLSNAKTTMNLIFLDACRVNPFTTHRGGQNGLAPLSPPTGTLVCFATAPGKVADDNREGKNGLYTQELLNLLTKDPKRPLMDALIETCRIVRDLSNKEQVPWENGSLLENFRFVSEAGVLAPATPVVPTNSAKTQPKSKAIQLYNDRNYKEAVPLLQVAAQEGEAEAQFDLGVCYQYGSGIEKDEKKAIDWYRKAAEQKFASAQTQLGYCYYNGIGTEKDPKQAVEWYTKADGLGDATAQSNLGICSQYGIGTEKNPEKAVGFYKKAADLGNATAQYYLALCLSNGTGTEKNPKQAFEWYTKAADQRYAWAQNDLGVCYEYGTGTPKNLEKAVEFYKKAAEQGDDTAQFNLTLCYENGTGVLKNPEAAVEWCTKSAKQGYGRAQKFLGDYYSTGYGVKKNFALAAEWYEKAATQGNLAAQVRIGNFYEDGTGKDPDPKQAVYWYQKATEQNNMSAQYDLGRCYFAGKGIEKDQKKALDLYTKSANQGYAPAQARLGFCYEYGVDQILEKDLDKAKEWYKKAAKQDEEGAIERLRELNRKPSP